MDFSFLPRMRAEPKLSGNTPDHAGAGSWRALGRGFSKTMALGKEMFNHVENYLREAVESQGTIQMKKRMQ